MKFRTLQGNLRKKLWERIDAGSLNGLRLAKQTGFRQAHISNFLNRKRGLSLEGMDKVLTVQHLSVLDLIDPAEINKRASIRPPNEDEFDNVVLTDSHIAASEALIMSMQVKGILKFRKTSLRRLSEGLESDRSHWERFVAIKLDTQEGMSMYPRTIPGANLLLDRHYNSLIPFRKGERNIYAVRKDSSIMIRYIEAADNQLILRPHNRVYPVEVLTLESGKKPSDYIVGRVCHVGIEI
ncbi:MAG: S24 family peptidase [Terriglobales bacterium]